MEESTSRWPGARALSYVRFVSWGFGARFRCRPLCFRKFSSSCKVCLRGITLFSGKGLTDRAIGLAEEMQAVVSSVSHSLVVLGSATKRSNGGNGGGGGVTLARPWGAVGAAELNGGSRKIAMSSSSFGARILPVSVKSKLRFRVSALQQASESRVKWVLDPVGELAHSFPRHSHFIAI